MLTYCGAQLKKSETGTLRVCVEDSDLFDNILRPTLGHDECANTIAECARMQLQKAQNRLENAQMQ